MILLYFVDRDLIEDKLQFIENQISVLQYTNKWDTAIEKAALERVCHTIIEGILDVGNAMIDGFIMRDPGSYEDIIDILEDEKVIAKEMSKSLKTVVNFRKNLVQHYTNIDHLDLITSFVEEIPYLIQFAPNIRDYLTNELGPVTAFKN